MLNKYPRDRLARKLEKVEIMGERYNTQETEKKIIASGSLAAILAFEFNPSDYVDKSMIFDLKKQVRKKVMDRLTESVPGKNDEF